MSCIIFRLRKEKENHWNNPKKEKIKIKACHHNVETSKTFIKC